MSFKALAQVTAHPDGTITGRVINHEIPGVGLVENGVYELGLETFSSKLDTTYVGKVEGKADES